MSSRWAGILYLFTKDILLMEILLWRFRCNKTHFTDSTDTLVKHFKIEVFQIVIYFLFCWIPIQLYSYVQTPKKCLYLCILKNLAISRIKFVDIILIIYIFITFQLKILNVNLDIQFCIKNFTIMHNILLENIWKIILETLSQKP